MKKKLLAYLLFISATVLMGCDTKSSIAVVDPEPSEPIVAEEDSTVIHVKAFDLPVSALMSEESKEALAAQKKMMAMWAETAEKCPSLLEVELDAVPAARECHRRSYYQSQFYKDLVERYAVDIKPQVIDGVYTEVFTPTSGVSENHKDKVLINFHGGSFIGGSRYGGQMESIPISAVGKIKVISVDYRMAPEHRFPAASDDAVAVYKALLKTYQPENIGVYGYSAGGVLTSQLIARIQKENLPRPAAVAMIAGAASDWEGDLMHIGGAIIDYDLFTKQAVDYLDGADLSSPLVRPAKSDEVLSKFPPSLLVSSTRDFALSNVIHTHRQLVRLGVEADLQLWEGMDHGLMAAHYTPEAREAYGVIADFFNRRLGK